MRDRDESDDIIEPEDSESAQADQSASKRGAPLPPLDPNDVIPVPVAMEPAEIDERAQAVEALRAQVQQRQRGTDDDPGMR